MTTVTDDFNRASGAFGANWSADTGTAGTDTGAPPAATNGGWRIYNNALVFDASTRNDAFCLRWVGTALASNDYYVQAVVDKATDNDNAPGVMGRKAAGTGDGNSDCYAVFPYSDTWWMFELTDSAETATLGTYGTTDALAHTVRLVCNGSRISADIDGTERIAVTGETTWATGGVGLVIGAYAVADALTWDNFEAADLASSTTHNGGAALGAAGWMLAQTSRIAMGGAGLGAAGWLNANGQLVRLGALSAGAAGFVGALGERVAIGAAELGGAGWLNANGQLVRLGALSAGAAGWLSGEGYRILEGGTGQGAAGRLNAETLKILIGSAGLEAIGRIIAEADATGTGTTYTGEASLDGHGYILAAAERIAQAESGHGAAGWLSTFGERVAQAAAELAGAGYISASGERVALGSIELPGAGWVSVSAVLIMSASASLGAAGYMSARVTVQATQISAGNRTPYSPNARDTYQPELRTGKAPRSRRIY